MSPYLLGNMSSKSYGAGNGVFKAFYAAKSWLFRGYGISVGDKIESAFYVNTV
jgi:hypothetical protein